VLVVRSADVVIAVGGGYGTLSEIGLALKLGRPVVGIGTWELARAGVPDPGVTAVADPQAALALTATLLMSPPSRPTGRGSDV
jgi:hypothetical protein